MLWLGADRRQAIAWADFDSDPRCYMGHLDHNGFVAHAAATCLDEFKGPLHADMGLPTSCYPFLVGALDCH